MKFIVIRNLKSDNLTLHSTVCSVAVKHYSAMDTLKALRQYATRSRLGEGEPS